MPVHNDCRFIGNITHPPHFHRIGAAGTPFLRFYLAVDDERDPTSYIRIVAYGDTALLTHPYLEVGSKLLVQARYRQRQRRDRQEKVHEFVAEQIVFIDKINWERGERVRLHTLRKRKKNGSS
jgi:single-stranded DNA-binding protein